MYLLVSTVDLIGSSDQPSITKIMRVENLFLLSLEKRMISFKICSIISNYFLTYELIMLDCFRSRDIGRFQSLCGSR